MNRQLRKFLVILAALLLAVSGCGKKNASESSQAEGTTGAAGESGTAAESTEAETLPPPPEVGNIDEYVTLGQYMNIEMTKESDVLTDDDIETAIANLCKNYAEPEKIMEGTVKEGDTAHIQFEGKRDGAAFEGGTGTKDLTIGSGAFIPGFEDGLIGVKVGETVDLNLTFPDPYKNNPDLAGKPVVFTVTVEYLCGETIVPEFDDNLAAKLGFDDTAAMKAALLEQLQTQKTSAAQSVFESSVWQKAVENAELLKDHQEIYDSYYDSFLEQYESTASMYGMSLEQYLSMAQVSMEDFQKMADEYADACMKQELVCRAIVEKEGLKVSEEEYKQTLADYYAKYSSYFADEAELEAYYGRARLENDVLWGQVIQMVIDSGVPLEAPEESSGAESTGAEIPSESTEEETASESTEAESTAAAR